MRISFLVNEVWGGWEPDDKFLAGTEDSIVNWASELKKRGHEVIVFRNGKDNENAHYNDKVPYIHREAFFTDDGNADVFINVKSHDFKGDDRFMNNKLMPQRPVLYLTNEFNASDLDLSAYAGVIWPSQWAVDNIPVNNKTFILPHGYDPELIYPARKVPKQCFYASSPDRGLAFLLQIWPSVVERHPDAILILTYGAKPNYAPNVINLGECDEETISQVYQTSDIWANPSSGGELYGMTGKKAQVAGCIPVIIPRFALKETVKTGYMAKSEDDYLNLLNLVLDKPMEDRDLLRNEIIATSNAFTWSQSTDILEGIIESVYNKASIK